MEKEREICQSNALTKSRYDFSRIQKNVIYKIIEKVRTQHQPTLFGDLIVQFGANDFAEISDKEHTERAKAALRDLRHKDIDIQDEQGNWLNVGFINYAQYLAKNRVFEVEVSKKIMPHLVELTNKFTQYSIVVAMSLKSKYSQRFYELACQYRNKKPAQFFIDIEELRDMFMLGSGYKLKTDIKKRIIDVAIAELKKAYEENNCDLWLDSWEVGKGEKTRFYFNIHTRQQKEDLIDIKGLENQLVAIDRMIRAIFKKDKKFCKRIIDALTLEPNKIPLVLEKLTYILDKEVKKNESPGALCRYALKHDFNIV